MFYEISKNNHGLPFNPFKSCHVPRGIAWVSTISRAGLVNLAPYSQSNNLGWDPPYVMFSGNTKGVGRRPDSVVNAEETGEFVFNMATYALREAVHLTSIIDTGIDEMAAAGLTPLKSNFVKPPRVGESPVSMECKLFQTIVLPSDTEGMFNSVVIGRVVGIHIKDEFIGADGKIDILKSRPLARLGYLDYTSVTDIFEMRHAKISQQDIDALSGGRVAAR